MTLAYLLDTMVVSEGFKKSPTLSVVTWLNQENPASLAVSVITFGEIAAGVEKQRLNDPVAFRRIDAWLQLTQAEFHDRTLPVTAPVAIHWGALYQRLRRRDTDLLIAATALEHDLTLVTRNVRHFEPTGVRLFNPYA